MTQQEFFSRTKFQVSQVEFWAIHEVYCNSDLTKDEFCKEWLRMNSKRIAAFEKAEKEAREAEKEAKAREIDSMLSAVPGCTFPAYKFTTGDMDQRLDAMGINI